jgi:carbonic anhydrase
MRVSLAPARGALSIRPETARRDASAKKKPSARVFVVDSRDASDRPGARSSSSPGGSSPPSRREVLALTTSLAAAVVPSRALASAASPAPPSPTKWGYADRDVGPLNWGSLRDADGALAYPACGCSACAQSPIDLSSVVPASNRRVGSLRDVCVPAPTRALALAVARKNGAPNFVAALDQSGATEGEEKASFGALVLDGRAYAFDSLHFHTPAENTIDGVARAMEMHLVHFAEDGSGDVAVLGVAFEEDPEEEGGRASPSSAAPRAVDVLLARENLAASDSMDANTRAGGSKGGSRRGASGASSSASPRRVVVRVDPSSLWDPSSAYYRWEGSLTTPPCTGGVAWVFQRSPMRVRRETVAAFRADVGGFPGNARPTQPLNGRRVRLYESEG